MIESHSPLLHVRADAHFPGRPDQHGDTARAGRSEQSRLIDVGLGLVHVADRLGRNAAGNQLQVEFVVGVPPLGVRGADVGEDELQSAFDRGRLSGCRVEVLIVPGALPYVVDRIGSHVGLRRPGRVAGQYEPDIERRLPAVGRDEEHVVLGGTHLLLRDTVGPFAQLADELFELDSRLDHLRDRRPRAVLTLGDVRNGELQVLCRFHIREHGHDLEHLGHVREPGESRFHAECRPRGRHLHRRDSFPECRRPRVKRLQSCRLKQIRPHKPLHHIRLGDRVRDRSRRHSRDHPLMSLVTQVIQLHLQVAGAGRPFDGGIADIRFRGQVLVHVHLVDDQVVDPGVFEAHAHVTAGVDVLLHLVFQVDELALQPLDGHRVVALGLLYDASELVDLPLDVRLLCLFPQGYLRERGLSEQDAVPIVRRGTCDELASSVGGDVLAGGREDACLRVDLQPLSRELFQHVIRDDNERFADKAHPPHLHHAHDRLGRFPGSDLMEKSGRRLGDHPCDRGALMSLGVNVSARPGSERYSPAAL